MAQSLSHGRETVTASTNDYMQKISSSDSKDDDVLTFWRLLQENEMSKDFLARIEFAARCIASAKQLGAITPAP